MLIDRAEAWVAAASEINRDGGEGFHHRLHYLNLSVQK